MFFFALWKQIKDQEFNMENLAEEWKVESKDAVNACSECTVMHLHSVASSSFMRLQFLVFMAPFAA